jgi:predicted transcriptional regulator
MSTTSLKLPDELKANIRQFAEQDGVSAHAFMVRALEGAVTRAQARKAFLDDAEASLDDALAGGPVYAAEDVHRWARARLRGEQSPEPKALRMPKTRAVAANRRRA